MDYNNSNGLVNGNIPKGQACHFVDECKYFRKEVCPTKESPKTVDFSCAMARLGSMLKCLNERKKVIRGGTKQNPAVIDGKLQPGWMGSADNPRPCEDSTHELNGTGRSVKCPFCGAICG